MLCDSIECFTIKCATCLCWMKRIAAAIRWHALSCNQFALFQFINDNNQIGAFDIHNLGQTRLVQTRVINNQNQGRIGQHTKIKGTQCFDQIRLDHVKRSLHVIADKGAQCFIIDLGHGTSQCAAYRNFGARFSKNARKPSWASGVVCDIDAAKASANKPSSLPISLIRGIACNINILANCALREILPASVWASDMASPSPTE